MIKPHLPLVLLLLMARAAAGEEILLKHAHLLDPAHQKETEGDLLLHDGRIRKIGSDLSRGFKGRTMDLSGKWIIPGLTDMHAHTTWGNPGLGTVQKVAPEDTARIMLYAGVTSYLDLFADENLIFGARARQHRAEWKGATLYAAGPMLTCSGGHGTEFGIPTRTMNTPAEARMAVRALASARKPDVMKLAYDHATQLRPPHTSMDEPTLRAALEEAKKLGIRTVVHIGTWQDAREAVLAGATIITHLYETDIPDELVKLMHERKVEEIPTMTYQTELVHYLDHPGLFDSPLLASVTTPELMASYKQMPMYLAAIQDRILLQRRGATSYLISLKKLSEGGVPLMTGTDSGGELAVFYGFSVHREMAVFVEAGLTPWQALAAGTSNAKKFLHLPSGIGVGEQADLVVLGASPLVEIANTQKIEMVIHRGKLVDRETLLPQRTVSGRK